LSLFSNKMRTNKSQITKKDYNFEALLARRSKINFNFALDLDA